MHHYESLRHIEGEIEITIINYRLCFLINKPITIRSFAGDYILLQFVYILFSLYYYFLVYAMLFCHEWLRQSERQDTGAAPVKNNLFDNRKELEYS